MIDGKMTDADFQRLIAVLEAKNADAPCRCGVKDWTLIDQFFMQPVSGFQGDNVEMMVCIKIICGNCGQFSAHALGPLGFILDKAGNLSELKKQ